MEIGGKMLVEMKSAATARHYISYRMPIYHPGLKFTTKKIKQEIDGEQVPVIEVTRTA
ncbi:hypothetical protein GCM10011418_33090 [Sphingobacterium alkalisoli]|nr:hypothetical protein GCM10011418_33090 [Sphingobacterium alkalisoli]